MIIVSTALLSDILNSVFKTFDMFFFRLFGTIQNNLLTVFFKAITFLGDVKFIAILLVISSALILFRKTRQLGIAVIVAIAFGSLITLGLLKPFIMRPRPFITLVDNTDFMAWYANVGHLYESDFSFPSGHTTVAFSYSMAFYLSLKKTKSPFRFVFPVIACLVMISRVYLMVHYASDVLFGMIIGILAGFIGYIISAKIEEVIIYAGNKNRTLRNSKKNSIKHDI